LYFMSPPVDAAATSEEEDAVVPTTPVPPPPPPPPPPSVLHMEEGEEGLIAVAITALDCCQNEVAVVEAVVVAVAGCGVVAEN